MKDNPVGSVGVTDHEVAAPPALVGTTATIAEFSVRLRVAVAYEISGGASEATTLIETVVVSLPALLLAVTVNVVCADVADGVPEICPVEELKDKPAVRVGLIDHNVAGEPAFDGNIGAIAVPDTKFAELGVYEISGTEATTSIVNESEVDP